MISFFIEQSREYQSNRFIHFKNVTVLAIISVSHQVFILSLLIPGFQVQSVWADVWIYVTSQWLDPSRWEHIVVVMKLPVSFLKESSKHQFSTQFLVKCSLLLNKSLDLRFNQHILLFHDCGFDDWQLCDSPVSQFPQLLSWVLNLFFTSAHHWRFSLQTV